MLGSLRDGDPTSVLMGLIVHRGVPARNRERGSWIIDAHERGDLVTIDPDAGHYKVYKRAGEPVRVECTSKIKAANPLIGVNRGIFEVTRRLEILQKDQSNKMVAYVNTGFREMQDLAWYAVRIPQCSHGKKTGEITEVPEGCEIFTGWRFETNSTSSKDMPRWDPEGPLHVALVAGSEPARWVMLFVLRKISSSRNVGRNDGDLVTYIRATDCCFSCAVKAA